MGPESTFAIPDGNHILATRRQSDTEANAKSALMSSIPGSNKAIVMCLDYFARLHAYEKSDLSCFVVGKSTTETISLPHPRPQTETRSSVRLSLCGHQMERFAAHSSLVILIR